MDDAVYQAVITRSGGGCEVEVESDLGWARCWDTATDVHHMLPKSRGGRLLDDYGETAHLIHVCRDHHAQAHSRKLADGLMIDGSVTWDRLRNQPVYRGTDPYLSRRYNNTPG